MSQKEVPIQDIKDGDSVQVTIEYCDQHYWIRDIQMIDETTLVGTVSQTAPPPEAPNVGSDQTVTLDEVTKVIR